MDASVWSLIIPNIVLLPVANQAARRHLDLVAFCTGHVVICFPCCQPPSCCLLTDPLPFPHAGAWPNVPSLSGFPCPVVVAWLPGYIFIYPISRIILDSLISVYALKPLGPIARFELTSVIYLPLTLSIWREANSSVFQPTVYLERF